MKKKLIGAIAAILMLGSSLLLAPAATANNQYDSVLHLNNDEGAIDVRTDKSGSTDWSILRIDEHDWFSVQGVKQEGRAVFDGTPNNRVEVHFIELQERVGTGDWIVIEHNGYNGTLFSPGDTILTDIHGWGSCSPIAPNGVKYRGKVSYHIWWGSSWGADEKLYASDAAYGQYPC